MDFVDLVALTMLCGGLVEAFALLKERGVRISVGLQLLALLCIVLYAIDRVGILPSQVPTVEIITILMLSILSMYGKDRRVSEGDGVVIAIVLVFPALLWMIEDVVFGGVFLAIAMLSILLSVAPMNPVPFWMRFLQRAAYYATRLMFGLYVYTELETVHLTDYVGPAGLVDAFFVGALAAFFLATVGEVFSGFRLATEIVPEQLSWRLVSATALGVLAVGILLVGVVQSPLTILSLMYAGGRAIQRLFRRMELAHHQLDIAL